MGKKKDKTKIKQIASQLLENEVAICKEIDCEFEKRNDSIVQYLSAYMAITYGERAEELEAYEWYDDDCPYDHSGELREIGYLPENITVGEFLEEYRGFWEPTFESGHGKRWNTYLDDLDYEIVSISADILYDVIDKHIIEIDSTLTDNEISEVRGEVYDKFYSKTKAGTYFYEPDFESSVLCLVYNNFVKLSEQKRAQITETNVLDRGYEYFYKMFYSAKS